jgi:hypothetical protein
MMQQHHDVSTLKRIKAMRTTIDIPEQEHRLFRSLALLQNTSLSKLIVELARRGLEASQRVEESAAVYTVSPVTGLPTFRSKRPITAEDVRSLEDDA